MVLLIPVDASTKCNKFSYIDKSAEGHNPPTSMYCRGLNGLALGPAGSCARGLSCIRNKNSPDIWYHGYCEDPTNKGSDFNKCLGNLNHGVSCGQGSCSSGDECTVLRMKPTDTPRTYCKKTMTACDYCQNAPF